MYRLQMIFLLFSSALVLALQRPVDIKNRPRIPIPDEDPYSVAGVSSSVGPSEIMPADRDSREQIYMQSTSYQHRRAERPPKLPPRENLYGHGIPKVSIKDASWTLFARAMYV